MKIRNSFVTNSSSSSFVINNSSEYKKPLNKDLIKECLDEILNSYCSLCNKTLNEKEEKYLKHLPERVKDYKVFEKDEIKEIAKAFHNECWSASGLYIPDEIHNVLRRANSTSFRGAPSRGEIEDALNKLAKFCIDNRIDPSEIFRENDDFEHDYYDYEFQEAIRGDFVIITGENAFPYTTFDLIEDILSAERFHLG